MGTCFNCSQKGELEKCLRCKRHFCYKCITPIEPGNYHPERSRIRINQIRIAHENTHPCAPYVDFLKEQKKVQDIRYGETLDRLTGRTPKYKLPLDEREQIREERVNVANQNEQLSERVKFRLEEDIRIRKEAKLKRKELERERRRHEIGEKEKFAKEIEEKPKDLQHYKDKIRAINDKVNKKDERHYHKQDVQGKELDRRHIPVKERPEYKDTVIIKKNLKERISDFRHKIKIKNIALVAFIFIITIAGLVFFQYEPSTDLNVQEVVKLTEQVSYEEIPIQISFKETLDNKEKIDGTSATLTGFLRYKLQGTDTSGVYIEVIVDDYDNEIKLMNIPSRYRGLFITRETSTELFNVTGKFKRKFMDLEFIALNITPVHREFQIIEKIIEIKSNISVSTFKRTKEESNFLEKLFSSFSKIGKCEDNERLYNLKCIPLINCTDGTLHPECSLDKPKQCVNGTLIQNAQTCGCQYDYRINGNSCEKIQRCTDGTEFDHCSKDKPYKCVSGQLDKDPTKCGCPWGYSGWENDCISSDKYEALQAFDYLNSLRKQYGKREISWDDRLYELGIFRSKDMYDRNYFDHVDPDGKCANSYLSDFGIKGYYLAENAGAVYTGYSDYDMSYASYANPKEQVNGWMESRGHRYNLLYDDHLIGSIACYKGACVFLGGHKDPYGLGAGPCSTGDEGSAYWATAGKQDGEV